MILRTLSVPVKTPKSRFRQVPWDRSSPEWIAIDAKLDADDLARLVDAAIAELDLSSLNTSYAGTGSEAYPPELMLRIVVYHLAIGESRPRCWAKACRENDPVKWLVFGITPSRGRLHAFQHRLAPHLEGWLQENIALAVALGITTATRGALDGSTIAANASRHRMLRRKTLDRRLKLLTAAVAADQSGATLTESAEAVGAAAAKPPWWLAKTPRGRRQQLQRYQRASIELDRRIAENARRKSERRRDPEKMVIGPGDPEAAVGRDKLNVYRPLYNAQVIYDLDSEMILGAEVFSQQNDTGTLRPMLTTFTTLTGHAPSDLLADSTYATVVDMRICAEFETTLYAPYQSNDFSDRNADRTARHAGEAKPAVKMFAKDRFRWDDASASYTCPAGHAMPRESSRTEPRAGDETVLRHVYRCPARHCTSCPLAAACTPNPSAGRTVSRVEGEERIEELRERMQTPEAKALYKLRCRTVERAYADVKTHRGLHAFPGRGKARASAHFRLRCLVHNMLVVARHARKQRDAPQDSHVAA